jgi:hypothetical protein
LKLREQEETLSRSAQFTKEQEEGINWDFPFGLLFTVVVGGLPPFSFRSMVFQD